jgi:hypothetical protein
MIQALPRYDPSSSVEDGAVHYGNSGVQNGWYGVKVLWIVAPAYRGPFLVRGRRADRTVRVRFGPGPHPGKELRTRAGTGGFDGGWPARPSEIRLRASGCYGFQIDGVGFSDVVIFKAAA